MDITTKLNILIVEDLKLVRDSFRLILEESGANNIFPAADAEQALQIFDQHTDIDIVLTDIAMPGMDGIALTAALNRKRAGTKVIILSMIEDDQEVARAFSAGARGYLRKTVEPEELIYCLHHVHRVGPYLDAGLALRFFHQTHPSVASGVEPVAISEREAGVLSLIAQGLTSSEISDRLFMSKRTVESYRRALMDKTGAKNTAELIHYATSHYLIKQSDKPQL